MVVVLIGVMAAMGIKYFIDAMDKARATGVEMLAWRFAQSASTLGAWSHIPAAINPETHGTDDRGVNWVMLNGVVIYLNENGWPFTTDALRSPLIGQQTAADCQQLLNAMLKPVMTYGDKPSNEAGNQYRIFVMDGRVCRYQLTQNTDEPWFFDYRLETGEVRLSVPRLKAVPKLTVERYTSS